MVSIHKILVTSILVIFMFRPQLEDCVVLYKQEEMSNTFRMHLVGKPKLHMQGLLFDIWLTPCLSRISTE